MKILTSKKYNEMLLQIKNVNFNLMKAEAKKDAYNDKIIELNETVRKLKQKISTMKGEIKVSDAAYERALLSISELKRTVRDLKTENLSIKSSNGGLKTASLEKSQKITNLLKEIEELKLSNKRLTEMLKGDRVQPTVIEYDQKLKYRKNNKNERYLFSNKKYYKTLSIYKIF